MKIGFNGRKKVGAPLEMLDWSKLKSLAGEYILHTVPTTLGSHWRRGRRRFLLPVSRELQTTTLSTERGWLLSDRGIATLPLNTQL